MKSKLGENLKTIIRTGHGRYLKKIISTRATNNSCIGFGILQVKKSCNITKEKRIMNVYSDSGLLKMINSS